MATPQFPRRFRKRLHLKKSWMCSLRHEFIKKNTSNTSLEARFLSYDDCEKKLVFHLCNGPWLGYHNNQEASLASWQTKSDFVIANHPLAPAFTPYVVPDLSRIHGRTQDPVLEGRAEKSLNSTAIVDCRQRDTISFAIKGFFSYYNCWFYLLDLICWKRILSWLDDFFCCSEDLEEIWGRAIHPSSPLVRPCLTAPRNSRFPLATSMEENLRKDPGERSVLTPGSVLLSGMLHRATVRMRTTRYFDFHIWFSYFLFIRFWIILIIIIIIFIVIIIVYSVSASSAASKAAPCVAFLVAVVAA